MADSRKRKSVVAAAAVFVILEIAAIFMLSGSRSLQDIWINKASHRTLATLWRSGESVRNYFSLDKQNKALTTDNLILSARIRELGAEAGTPGKELADTVFGHFRYIPATIVKMSRNTQHNYIILDKGSADGIRPQSGIITSNGVVGVVHLVDEHYSYGITLMNPMLSVSARVGKAGPVATLGWDGHSSNGAVLRNLPLHHSIAKGDTVWTSGFSSVFPNDIPIGVADRVRMVDGSLNEADVKLFQDFGALRYVVITDNLDRDEISALEKEAVQ